MSLLRRVFLSKGFIRHHLNIQVELSRHLTTACYVPQNRQVDSREVFLCADTRTSKFQVRTLAKQVKGGKKGKGKKSLDDILDEFDSDGEDDGDAATVKSHATLSHDHDDEFLGQTPAAKFIQNFSKGGKKDPHHKDKSMKMKSKGGHHSMVTYSEAKILINVDQFWTELEGVVNDQRDFFINHLSLRSASALDDLPVLLEGDTFPLREIAEISKKDPKRLIIDTSAFPQATVNIMKTLRETSGLNLNPQQDGTRIYVPIPKVTREHREKLSKGAKQKCNETKEQLRKLQSKKISLLSQIELEGKIHAPKNNFLSVHELLIGMTDHWSHEAEAMAAKKQKDLMESS